MTMGKDKLLLEAIALKKCIHVSYNRDAVKMAPHILYTRHGELYIDAVVIERAGRPPRERKLGCYKVDGLTGMVLTQDKFSVEPVYDAADPKYADSTVFAI